MAMTRVSIEKWRLADGRTVEMAVARVDGKIRSRRPVKGSGIRSEQEFKRIFTENRTLYEDRIRLSNVMEYRRTSPVRRDLDKPVSEAPENEAQYEVSGVVRGRRIIRRSPKLGSPSARTAEEARAYAYESFYKELGSVLGTKYDADEGLKYADQVTDIREGWVYYKGL